MCVTNVAKWGDFYMHYDATYMSFISRFCFDVFFVFKRQGKWGLIVDNPRVIFII